MMEKEIKEKKSNGSKVVIFILVILLLGACAYIAYDKLMVKEDISNNNVQGNKKIKEENLDVNSRLIQSLYNKVSTGEQKKEDASCIFNYMYGDSDFYSEKATEEEKMRIVGRVLSPGKVYSGDESLIPDKIDNDTIEIMSIIAYNKDNDKSIFTEKYYDRKYVENTYKELFGTDSKLDTSVTFENVSTAGLYSYVPAVDKYLLYLVEGGGITTCGPTSTYATLTKAVKVGDKIKIFEKETGIAIEDTTIDNKSYTKGQVASENNYIYTFKLDKDGMYSFISRVKE